MKKIKHFLILILAVFLFSCEEDFTTPPVTSIVEGTAPTWINQPSSDIDTVLFKKNEKEELLSLSWNAPVYADHVGVRYFLQIDSKGNDFSAPIEFDRISDTQMTVTIGQLNSALIERYAPVEKVEIELRIKAKSNEDLADLFTTPFSMKVTPYLDVPVPSELYIYGTGTPAAEVTGALQAHGEADIFTKYLKIEQDGLFKFSEKQESGGYDYNFGKFAAISDNIEAAGDEAGNFKFTGETGWYELKADFANSELTIAPYVFGAATYTPDPAEVYLVGDYNATVPAWSPDNSPALTKKSDGIYTIETNIKDGALLKFVGQPSWGDLDWGNLGGDGNTGILGPKGTNGNIQFDGGGAVYDITFDLNAGTYTIAPKPVFPTELFMTGNGVGLPEEDWNWFEPLQLVPVHSHPELFWKIVWMKGSGNFKFAPQAAWAGGDFGKTGDATDGVYTIGGEDIPVPSTEGYYMVVVDLANNTIEITEPKVYGMGNVFGGWDSEVPANLFTVDNANEVIQFEGVPNDGELRMYVAAPTLNCDWWQAEFIILNDRIEFRGTGNDQTRVNVTTGDNISLNFKTGAGSIMTP